MCACVALQAGSRSPSEREWSLGSRSTSSLSSRSPVRLRSGSRSRSRSRDRRHRGTRRDRTRAEREELLLRREMEAGLDALTRVMSSSSRRARSAYGPVAPELHAMCRDVQQLGSSSRNMYDWFCAVSARIAGLFRTQLEKLQGVVLRDRGRDRKLQARFLCLQRAAFYWEGAVAGLLGFLRRAGGDHALSASRLRYFAAEHLLADDASLRRARAFERAAAGLVPGTAGPAVLASSEAADEEAFLVAARARSSVSRGSGAGPGRGSRGGGAERDPGGGRGSGAGRRTQTSDRDGSGNRGAGRGDRRNDRPPGGRGGDRRSGVGDNQPRPGERGSGVDVNGACTRCLDQGHPSFDCANPSKCRKCKQAGHKERDCTNPRVV